MNEDRVFDWGTRVGILGPLSSTDYYRLESIDELASLDEGADIWVIWRGGSGPHHYKLHKQFDTKGNPRLFPVPCINGKWEDPDLVHQYTTQFTRISDHPFTQVFIKF